MTKAEQGTQTITRRRRTRTGGLIAIGLILAALMIGHLSVHVYFYHDMPNLPPSQHLWSVRREPSLQLLDVNGEIIGTRGAYYGVAVDAGELPAHLIHAFIATEDRRFWEHDGVDRRAIVRALVANWREGDVVQGGSTITQQLVKMLFLTREQTLRRKLQEIRLARMLEQELTKPEILTLYLNRVFLGQRTFGVDAAARRYFGHPATEVTLAEAALLAGMVQAPSRFDPTRNIDQARARAREVLDNMVEAGYITRQRADEAIAAPAELQPPEANAFESEIGYVFDQATRDIEGLLADDTPPDLVIRSTIDMSLQRQAIEALTSALDEQGEEAEAGQGAVVALDRSGAIRALVGGRSWTDSPFNRATQAERQPGSAFKAIVFAAALERGIQPDQFYYDEQVTIGDWTPRNYGGVYTNRPMSVREAFRRSTNSVAAQIVQDIGADAVVATAQRFGLDRDFLAVPSIALGAQEVTLLELAGAYSVFLNEGALYRPHLIAEIRDTRGEVLYRRPEAEPPRAYDAELSRQMTAMLREVVTDGTGRRAAVEGLDVAGKTGTSQSWRDAWFVGYSSQLIAGVWIGNDDDTPMDRVAGGGLPAEIWSAFMTAAHGEGGAAAGALNAAETPVTSSRADELGLFYAELAASFGRAIRQ